MRKRQGRGQTSGHREYDLVSFIVDDKWTCFLHEREVHFYVEIGGASVAIKIITTWYMNQRSEVARNEIRTEQRRLVGVPHSSTATPVSIRVAVDTSPPMEWPIPYVRATNLHFPHLFVFPM